VLHGDGGGGAGNNFVCAVSNKKKEKTERLKEYYGRTDRRIWGVSGHLKTLVRKATGSPLLPPLPSPPCHSILLQCDAI